MSSEKRITQELTLGEVFSRTFELYRLDFSKYIILFVVVEAIVGILTTLVRGAIVLPPALPANATPQEIISWAPGYFSAQAALIALSAIVTLVFYPISIGSAVKIASDGIVTGRADLAASVRSAVSRIVWLWVVGIVVGIIVILGFIALFVPGVILAIMFSLVLPALIIEGTGFGSMSRSRQLVSHRWLKTLVLFIIFGIIIGIASAIVSAISAPFGVASTIVSSILSAFYLPLIPIMLTVYYYSNSARITPLISQPPPAPGTAPEAALRFCPNCGAQISSTTMFCPACGTRQPA